MQLSIRIKLKQEVKEIRNNSEVGKNINQFAKEMKSLKADYKDFIEALRKLTHERTKAVVNNESVKGNP